MRFKWFKSLTTVSVVKGAERIQFWWTSGKYGEIVFDRQNETRECHLANSLLNVILCGIWSTRICKLAAIHQKKEVVPRLPWTQASSNTHDLGDPRRPTRHDGRFSTHKRNSSVIHHVVVWKMQKENFSADKIRAVNKAYSSSYFRVAW